MTQPATKRILTEANAAAAYAKVRDPRIGSRTLPSIPVGSSCYTSSGNLITASGTSRSPHKIAFAASDLRLMYGNWWVSDVGIMGQDTDGPSAYTVAASIEINGVIYRVTFGGRTQTVIDPGGLAITDPLGFEVAAGDTIYVRTYISAAGGSFYANVANYNGGTNTGGFTSGSDLTAPGSAAISSSVVWMYAPMAVMGKPIDPAAAIGVGVAGDSISVGFQAGGMNGSGVGGYGGYITRALEGKAGMVNGGHPSEKASTFKTPAAHFRRFSALTGCTHVICQYGINDVRNNDTLATVQANLLTIWTQAGQRGARVLQTTITPDTTSTDAWATTTNQAIRNTAQNDVRVALNDWIRAGAPIDSTTKVAVAVGTSGALLAGKTGHPLLNYLEVADATETARNSGIWKAGYTADGLHPNTYATDPTRMGVGIDIARFTF